MTTRVTKKPAEGTIVGDITFMGYTNYWASYKHEVRGSKIRSLAKAKWGLVDGPKGRIDKSMPIPPRPEPATGWGGSCRPTVLSGCNQYTAHKVPAQQVYDFATKELGMVLGERVIERVVEVEKIVEKVVVKKQVVEKIVEVPIERGYHGTFEKREVLSFALTRELRGTEHALRQAYIDNDAEESLRLAARVEVIREVMADLTVDIAEGSPQVVVARSPYKGTGGLFDGM